MTVEPRVIARQLALLMLVLTALLGGVALFACAEYLLGPRDDAHEPLTMLLSTLVAAVFGGLLFVVGKRGSQQVAQRDALLLVALSWLVGAALAALPFYIWAAQRPDAATSPHPFDHFADCYFEAMSGLTTTGATVVSALETLPRSLLLWRATTHWIGGLGIVVLFVAVLPLIGVGSRRLYRQEAPGPSPDGVTPRISDAARVLWFIYSGLTLAEVVSLRVCGMNWFDSVCHTMATLATGGFGVKDASIAAYDSTLIHVVIIVFMFLAGVNFALFHRLLQRQWRQVFQDRELRAYVAIMLAATGIIMFNLLRQRSSASDPAIAAQTTPLLLRDVVFQVVSIQTTTGFGTVDFDRWDFVSKATLLVLMFIGGCAGSTGGGIKIVRILVAFKVFGTALERIYRPRVVRSLKLGATPIDPALRLDAMVYLVGIAALFAVGSALLMVFEQHQSIDITTAATASAATLNNIGPGFARVGPTMNYAWFSTPSKMILCMLMVLGRLEMFTILALFTPRFWRGD